MFHTNKCRQIIEHRTTHSTSWLLPCACYLPRHNCLAQLLLLGHNMHNGNNTHDPRSTQEATIEDSPTTTIESHTKPQQQGWSVLLTTIITACIRGSIQTPAIQKLTKLKILPNKIHKLMEICSKSYIRYHTHTTLNKWKLKKQHPQSS